jgi:hypothetical protein
VEPVVEVAEVGQVFVPRTQRSPAATSRTSRNCLRGKEGVGGVGRGLGTERRTDRRNPIDPHKELLPTTRTEGLREESTVTGTVTVGAGDAEEVEFPTGDQTGT